MNNRKSHNSILFLTTLGVYLGLVLVGATPVLGHAATTRNFEIQDEIEVKDDFDNKPGPSDDLEKDAKAVDNLKIAEAITAFITDLKQLQSIGKVDPGEDLVFSHKLWLEEFGSTYTSSKNSDISNPWLETAIGELISKAGHWDTTSISDWLSVGCEGHNCRKSSIDVASNSNDFSLRFGFEKSSHVAAKVAAKRFTEVLEAKKRALRGVSQILIYETIHCIAENNQVFIVTRLPRAGLDSLLAKSAK